MNKISVRDENFNPRHEGDDHFIMVDGKKYGYRERTDNLKAMDMWLYDIFVTL